MNKAEVSYQDAVKGSAFNSIKRDTIPSDIRPKDPGPITSWSAAADQDLIGLARDVADSALMSLPIFFKSEFQVNGIRAQDLFSLNTFMGATIEESVVDTLNSSRKDTWDKSGKWSEYAFIRSAQAFPDVRLVKYDDPHDIKIGIELKSWFLLSKEGEPSLRFVPHPDACADLDILCVVPWYMSNVVSGTPRLGLPWVKQAKYSTLWSMYYWEYLRETKSMMTLSERGFKPLVMPCSPYPQKSDAISLHPVTDPSGNYGRLPRYSPIMDAFCKSALSTEILGIPAEDWRIFLKLHSESADADKIRSDITSRFDIAGLSDSEKVIYMMDEIIDILSPEND